MFRIFIMVCSGMLLFSPATGKAAEEALRLATFQADVTPPLGSPLCNGNVKPVMEITTPLTARGIVLLGSGKPIVLCAFDWVGIGNGSYDQFRTELAKGVGTTADRVALHTLHQHDAPGSDFITERMLAKEGLSKQFSNADFDAQVMKRVATAARQSLAKAQPVTHFSHGAGRVEKVASNRRILGPDGKVALRRMSKSTKPEAKAAPEGTIDPLVRMIVFWQNKKPLSVLTYYATHPQSYYGQGLVNWDFVGYARQLREKALPGVPHIHFNGAGGNVAAGKYNDGSKKNRPLLAQRLADGMQLAWNTQQKSLLTARDVGWKVEPVSLPVSATLTEAGLKAKIKDKSLAIGERLRSARDLSFVQRMNNGHRIPLSCLQLGDAHIVHMPGELFVEYQLATQQMAPGKFIAMAAYGDYGPGYIGTRIAYGQGGYETGRVSRVAPEVETVLLNAARKLLQAQP